MFTHGRLIRHRRCGRRLQIRPTPLLGLTYRQHLRRPAAQEPDALPHFMHAFLFYFVRMSASSADMTRGRPSSCQASYV